MSQSAFGIVVLLIVWIGYFALHSLLAALSVKSLLTRRWPALGPAYRLLYNAVALLLVVPALWLTFALDGPYLWRWAGPWAWVSSLGAVVSLLGFVWSLRYYDGLEFAGWRQWQRRANPSQDLGPFILSPLHRFVRHPWYFLGLMLAWTRDMTVPLLVSVLAMTLYLIVGSRLEERKLIQHHGEIYRRYRVRVPALVPLPWRYLRRAEAEALLQAARPAGVGPGQVPGAGPC